LKLYLTPASGQNSGKSRKFGQFRVKAAKMSGASADWRLHRRPGARRAPA
jgi:hypothetical protein